MENLTEYTSTQYIKNSCTYPLLCIVEVIIVVAVTFLAVVGNIGNLAILLLTPALRNSHGYLLTSLSVADLMTGLVSSLAVYPAATLRSSPASWPYGDTACLVVAYINQVGVTTSAISLMLLSLERYVAIAHPLRYARTVTKRRVFYCIALKWVAAVGSFGGIFAGYPGYFYYPELYTCLTFVVGYATLSAVWLGMTLVPVLVVFVTSCLISRILRKGLAARAGPSAVRSSTKLKLRTFRMVQVMTTTFFLVYAPFFLVGLVLRDIITFIPQAVVFSAFWLLIANSFFNTVIYVRMNTSYRRRMGEMFDSLTTRISRLGSRRGGWDVKAPELRTVDSKEFLVGDLVATSSHVYKACHDSSV